MNLRSITAAIILTAASYSSQAQTAPATLPADNARIHNGVKTGELTPAERARLKSKERNIRREKRAYKADGVITPGERRDLRKDKRGLSRSIYKQKHDAQTTAPKP